ncbi:MAG: septum site-determining protein MinD [Nitrospinota bacterium]
MEGKVIVITSGKGGVGKSTGTASIGGALAMEGKKVCVLDMDIGLRNLDVLMGLENRIVYNIVDVVRGKCKIMQAAIKSRRIENLYLIPASQSDNKDSITPEEVSEFCKLLKKEFEYILIDCPAGIERGFENSIEPADEAVVICNPEVSSIRDADRVIGLLYAKSITPKLVVNRIVPDMVSKGEMLSHEDVVDILSIDLLGLVPMDDQAVVAANTGEPLVLFSDSPAGKAFRRIGMRLNGQPDLPIQVPVGKKSFWEKMGLRKTGRSN